MTNNGPADLRNSRADASAAFGALLGGARGVSGRPRHSDEDVFAAFLCARPAANPSWVSRPHPDGVCALTGVDGALYAIRLGVTSEDAEAASQNPLVEVLVAADGPSLPDPPCGATTRSESPAGSFAHAAGRTARVRNGLGALGFDTLPMLLAAARSLTALQSRMLLCVEQAGGISTTSAVAAAVGMPRRDTLLTEGVTRLHDDGFVRSGGYQLSLTDDGRTAAAAARAAALAEAPAQLNGPARGVLEAMAATDLKATDFRVRVGLGCSLGATCEQTLRDAGLAGQVRRVDVELDALLHAQSFCPPLEVRMSLRNALLAAAGTGVLSDRDRSSLWNPWRNVCWQDPPAAA